MTIGPLGHGVLYRSFQPFGKRQPVYGKLYRTLTTRVTPLGEQMMLDVGALTTFAAIPAPTGSEAQRLDWLEHRLAYAPGVRRRDEVGDLIWSDRDGVPALLVMAHIDTVFDELSAPEIVRDADDLVGPGVGDNAAAVIALVSVLESLGGLPPGVAVAFTVGEEGLGNLRGAHHVCERLRPIWALALEGHGLDGVVTNHVGSVRVQIEVNGPGGHSWWDRGTPSAVHALAELASQLARVGANVGAIAGGGAVNAIAAHADMLVELRSLEPDELTSFVSEIDALTVAEPLRLAHEIVGVRPAGRIPTAHPLVQRIFAERRALGLPEHCESGSTDANAAAALGIPAAAIGCGHGTGMHTIQERISIPSLELGCRQLAAVLPALARAANSEL